MADKITTLQLKADPDTKIYPNVRDENIPDTIARKSALDEVRAEADLNKERIAMNASDISAHARLIAGNTANITDIRGSVTKNASDISGVASEVSQLGKKVATDDLEAKSGTVDSLHATDFELGDDGSGNPLIYNDSNDRVQMRKVNAIMGEGGDPLALVFDKRSNIIYFTYSYDDEDYRVNIPRPITNQCTLIADNRLTILNVHHINLHTDFYDIYLTIVDAGSSAYDFDRVAKYLSKAPFNLSYISCTGTAYNKDEGIYYSVYCIRYEDTSTPTLQADCIGRDGGYSAHITKADVTRCDDVVERIGCIVAL